MVGLIYVTSLAYVWGFAHSTWVSSEKSICHNPNPRPSAGTRVRTLLVLIYKSPVQTSTWKEKSQSCVLSKGVLMFEWLSRRLFLA